MRPSILYYTFVSTIDILNYLEVSFNAIDKHKIKVRNDQNTCFENTYRLPHFATLTSKLRMAVQPYNKEFYCLDDGQGMNHYPISLFVRKDNEIKHEMNKIIRHPV